MKRKNMHKKKIRDQKIQDPNTLFVGPEDTEKWEKSILKSKNSVVVVGNDDELFDRCRDVFSKRGYKVWTLDFDHPEKSIAYCPFNYIEIDHDVSLFCYELYDLTDAHSLIQNEEFDRYAEEELLGSIVHYLCFHRTAYDQNFSSIIKLLNVAYSYEDYPEEDTPYDKIFKEIGEAYPQEEGVRMYKQFCRSDHKDCLVASCMARMMQFNTDEIAAITKRDYAYEFDDLHRLGKERIAFLIKNNESAASEKILPLLLGHIYSALSDLAVKNGKKLPVGVDIFLNDFGRLQKIGKYQYFLTVATGYGIHTTISVGSVKEISARYHRPDARVILSAFQKILYDETIFVKEKTETDHILSGKIW